MLGTTEMAARDPKSAEKIPRRQLVAGSVCGVGGWMWGWGSWRKIINKWENQKNKVGTCLWVGTKSEDRSQTRRHRFSFPTLSFDLIYLWLNQKQDFQTCSSLHWVLPLPWSYCTPPQPSPHLFKQSPVQWFGGSMVQFQNRGYWRL